MRIYDFRRLVNKYGKAKPALKTTSGGYYDYDNGGEWVDGVVEFTPFDGAVTPISERVIYDNGAYTADDKNLYTYADIGENQTVRFKDKDYTTMQVADYGDYDCGLKAFILKRGGVK